MTKGIRAYDFKDRRKVRLRNHFAKDLGTPKYRQRIKEPKKRYILNRIREEELQREIEEENSTNGTKDFEENEEAT